MKTPSGRVRLQVARGRLRLDFTFEGKRHYLYVGLPDSPVNRLVAEQKARQIEADMATGNFDRSLVKYKPPSQLPQLTLTCSELFVKFTEQRSKKLSNTTLPKYRAIAGFLDQFFGQRLARSITAEDGEKFAHWLMEQRSAETAKDRLTLIRSCWGWAVKKRWLSFNPWQEVQIKVPPKQMPRPFTRDEIKAIIQGFRSSEYYSYLGDYVEFLFGTGCRTGEAIGLKWQHLNEDCSTVWFGESVSRGVRKSTRTNRARTIALTTRLQTMLLSRKPVNVDPEDLVFQTPNGQAINDLRFRGRAWKKVLNQLGIEYRKPYCTRHTMVSHALEMGKSPVEVAALVGNSPEMIYKNYAGHVSSRLTLPEI